MNVRVVNDVANWQPVPDVEHRAVVCGATPVTVVPVGGFAAATTHILVQVTGASVRVTWDGATDPEAAVGFLFPAGSQFQLNRAVAQRMRWRRSAATNAALHVQEFRTL